MLTQVHVESELMRLSEMMEQKTRELAVLAEQAAINEATYKAAYAKAYLEAEGPGHIREQDAVRRTHTLYMKRKISEAVYQSCKESLASIRAQLDALRTISANLRGQT